MRDFVAKWNIVSKADHFDLATAVTGGFLERAMNLSLSLTQQPWFQRFGLVSAGSALLVCLMGCRRPDANQAESAALARAHSAAQTLGQRLRERLTSTLAASGPLAAVEVCAHEAPSLRESVEKEYGVRVGRASLKLRNPQDSAPSWVDDWLRAQQVKQQPRPINRVRSGTAQVLMPIMIEPLCLTCHGDPEAMPQELRDAIHKHYPHDQATGYHSGDVRGALWAESRILR